MFFGLQDQNLTLVNGAVEPQISHLDRMIYLALSEFFFDSGLFSYFQAGIFHTRITNEKVEPSATPPPPRRLRPTQPLPFPPPRCLETWRCC